MPDQVTLVPERLAALRTLVRLLLRGRRRVVGVVVEVLMPLEELLLTEHLITLVTFERFLVRVDEHVRLEVALRDRRVRTQVTLEALLALVRLLVYLQQRSGMLKFRMLC